MDLKDELINIKNGVKGCFEQQAEDFHNTLKEINEKAEERDMENKERIRDLTRKIEQFENNTKHAFIALSNSISKPKTASVETSCNQPRPAVVPMPVQRPEIKEPKKRKTKYLEKSKVLFIADSVGRNVDFRKLEKASNVRIRTRRAYSSVFNTTTRWPEINVPDVIKHEVNKVTNEDKYDVLVMSAPTVDITNLDTAQVKATDNVEFFKQEVLISSKNMISAAENTLKSELNIKKAIILCHPPRFDRPEVDPLMLKQKLAKFANDQLHQLWLDSPLKDKIFIAEHKLNCNMNVRMDRYTDEHTKKYDGIHMYGESGRSAYTESVVSALKEALSVQYWKPTQSSHIASPPPQSEPTDKNYHKYCPQAQYAKGYMASHAGYPSYHHSVKDSNRFSVFNQGNL